VAEPVVAWVADADGEGVALPEEVAVAEEVGVWLGVGEGSAEAVSDWLALVRPPSLLPHAVSTPLLASATAVAAQRPILVMGMRSA
jgi:hypothetical protein